MKRHRFEFSVTPVQRFLFVLGGIIIVVVLFVTAWALTSKPERVGRGLRRIDPAPVSLEKSGKTDTAVYEDIGQLRAITADVPAVSLIVTPYFSYPTNDTAFYEEIVQKKRQIRSLALNYFALYTKDELLKNGEERVKQDLIDKINNELTLGQISVLYFNEYLFLN